MELRLATMKPSVRLLNCARGGIINEADLCEALKDDKIGGAALDVYESEPLAKNSPLRDCPNLILTPHLGASTVEAQDNVGLEVAQGISDYLLQGSLMNSINMPSLDAQTSAKVQPYLRLGEKMGVLLAKLGQVGTERLAITYGGLATELPGDPIARSIIKGFLGAAEGEEVNLVNVRSMAKERGLVVEEIKSTQQVDFREWLHIRAWAGEEKVSVAGSFFGLAQHPRIVRLNSQPVEIVPDGILFMMLMNSTEPRFLISEQVRGAPFIDQFGIDTVPTGYLVMAPGGEVGRVGKADLVQANEPERVRANALTASMYGFHLLYLEAGSGADSPVNPDLIHAARSVEGLTVMVGGGLRDGDAVRRAVEAGADWVVTGTLIEETADSTALVQALDDVLSGLSVQSSS
mgnify:CR=1 FL=1